MSKFTKMIAILLLLIVLCVPVSALAAPAAAVPSPDLSAFLKLLQEMIGVLKGMTALAALLVIAVNFAKSRGWVKDDVADIAFQLLNLVALVVLTLVKYFNPSVDFGALDKMLKVLMDNFTVILPALLVIIRLIGQVIHGSVRGIPLIGYSHSRSLVGYALIMK